LLMIGLMAILFLVGMNFVSLLYAGIPAGKNITDDIAARPVLALSMLSGMAAGVLAFLTGLLAIIRQKERSVLVYLSTISGLISLTLMIGGVVSPH